MAKRLTRMLSPNNYAVKKNYGTQRFREHPPEKFGTSPFRVTSFTGNILRAKMQDMGPFTWNASSPTPEENDSYKQSHETKDEDTTLTMDPNSSMWRAITSDHKEIEEKPKDQTLSIQHYYRERWIQEHKEKRSDNITKQAVKIFPDEPTPQQTSGQSPHEASIYKKLANKKIPANEMKALDNEKDQRHDSLESMKISRRISADQFDEDDYKNINTGDRFSGSLNSSSLFRSPEIPLMSSQSTPCLPKYQQTERNQQMGRMSNQGTAYIQGQKELPHHTAQSNHAHINNMGTMNSMGINMNNMNNNQNNMSHHQTKYQNNCDNWTSVIDGESSKLWSNTKIESKTEPPKGPAIVPTDTLVTFKPDM